MEIINLVLKILVLIFISIVFTKIFMFIANLIGEKLGFGKFFMHLLEKKKRKS